MCLVAVKGCALFSLCIPGALPGKKTPFALTITSVSDIRGFSDFYTEFHTHLNRMQAFNQAEKIRMICLTSDLSFELKVFQVSNRVPCLRKLSCALMWCVFVCGE